MVPVRAGPGHLEDMAKWRRVHRRWVGGFPGQALRTHPALQGDLRDPQAVARAAQRLQQRRGSAMWVLVVDNLEVVRFDLMWS